MSLRKIKEPSKICLHPDISLINKEKIELLEKLRVGHKVVSTGDMSIFRLGKAGRDVSRVGGYNQAVYEINNKINSLIKELR